MTKTKKIIILVAAAMIIFSILYPPYYRIGHLITSGKEATVMIDGGWEWIFDMSKIKNVRSSEAQISIRAKVRFDILSLEIFGILVIAGAIYIVTKK